MAANGAGCARRLEVCAGAKSVDSSLPVLGLSVMVSAHDVAKFILRECGELTAMKLQKLLFYCQAWSLVWEEEQLFGERIEAWANGPVIREIYDIHRGAFRVADWPKGNADVLTAAQQETVKSVIGFYADKTAQWLSDLSHREEPWINARKGLAEGERGSSEISCASMHEYYSGLAKS